MSIENNVNLLWEASKTLQREQKTHKLLKSYYINMCRKLAKSSTEVPNEKFSISNMCPYCGSFWNDSEYGLKFIPKQVKVSSKSKRLIEKLEQDNGAQTKILNKRQRNRAKWLRKKTTRYLAIKCYQCQHRSLQKLENTKPESLVQLLNLKNKGDRENESIASGKCKKYQKSIATTSDPSKIKPKKNISGFKNKQKLGFNTSTKVTSKTQKKNSLLQLASLLQKQSKSGLTNSSQKNLQSFLK